MDEQLQIESITGAVSGDEVLVPLRCALGSALNHQASSFQYRAYIACKHASAQSVPVRP